MFGWYEVRRQRRGCDPLVVPTLFRKRAFTGGLIAGTAYFAGMLGFSLSLSLYLQTRPGLQPAAHGPDRRSRRRSAWSPASACRRSAARPQARPAGPQGGVVVMALAALGFLATVPARTGVSPWQLAPALAVFGIGMGLAMAPFFDIMLAGVSPKESGSASGALNAAQQFAGALGVATLGTLFFNRAVGAGGVPGAIEAVLWAVTGLLALTFALSFLLPRVARPE